MSELKPTTLDEDILDLEQLILRLSWYSRRWFQQELDAFGLTVPQHAALRCVLEHGNSCTMSQLAESSLQVSATMTGIVDRLVDRGLVRRERDLRDRRTLRVEITAAGRQLMEQISATKRAWMAQFLAELSPEERRMMIAMGRHYLALLESSVRD